MQKCRMNNTSKSKAETTAIPVIISDREVLHRASSEIYPRVTRVQEIEYQGKISEVNFWSNADGSLHHVA